MSKLLRQQRKYSWMLRQTMGAWSQLRNYECCPPEFASPAVKLQLVRVLKELRLLEDLIRANYKTYSAQIKELNHGNSN